MSESPNSTKPVAVLIAALGGEGGGVLTDWLVDAALRCDLPVQATSIPGVAQRTGATTYYVEIFPHTNATLAGRRPVLGLYPVPGDIDVMVATELVEAGRAMENGFVTPERTTLISATHRVYSTSEKIQMGDGRIDGPRILRAAREMPKQAILFDLSLRREHAGLPLNAVLFGCMIGSERLPLTAGAGRAAIGASGIAVDANLRGFDAGLELARSGAAPVANAAPGKAARNMDGMRSEIAAAFPAECIETMELGLARVRDYQSESYARLYLDRMQRIWSAERPTGSAKVTNECARVLALWMAYEDVIRVADLKSRPERFAEVRREAGAKPDQPIRITEFFKPGIEEVSALLPPFLGRPLYAWAEKRNLLGRLHVPMHVTATSISGYLRLRLLASLRPWRPFSWRYSDEQAMIGRWLDSVLVAIPRGTALGLEVAGSARLLKGYSDTYRRGRANFIRIMAEVIEPAVALNDPQAATRIAQACKAALADPEGASLAAMLANQTP